MWEGKDVLRATSYAKIPLIEWLCCLSLWLCPSASWTYEPFYLELKKAGFGSLMITCLQTIVKGRPDHRNTCHTTGLDWWSLCCLYPYEAHRWVLPFCPFWVATLYCRQQWYAWNVSMTSPKTIFTGGLTSTMSGRISQLYGQKVLSKSDLRCWIWM